MKKQTLETGIKSNLEQVSQELKDSLLVEEYKFTVDRIKTHEERMYQLLLLNVTGFAAIFGLSNQIANPIIPIALLSVLVICARDYSLHQYEQLSNTAYLITRFEKKLGFLHHDTGYIARYRQLYSNTTPKKNIFMRVIKSFEVLRNFVAEPFVILTAISFVGSLLFTTDLIISYLLSNQIFLIILGLGYEMAIVLGHLFVIRDVVRRRRYKIEELIEWWQTYLQNKPNATPTSDSITSQ